MLFRDGRAAGLREGRELGIRTGFEVGEELGFYDGCTKAGKQPHLCSQASPVSCACNLIAPQVWSTPVVAFRHVQTHTHTPWSKQVWRRQQLAAPATFPARAEKSIAAIEELVAGFPLCNPQDERLQELMDELRVKFKVATAALGLREHYLSKQPKVHAPMLDF